VFQGSSSAGTGTFITGRGTTPNSMAAKLLLLEAQRLVTAFYQ
jgi:hypothetical protein